MKALWWGYEAVGDVVDGLDNVLAGCGEVPAGPSEASIAAGALPVPDAYAGIEVGEERCRKMAEASLDGIGVLGTCLQDSPTLWTSEKFLLALNVMGMSEDLRLMPPP